MSDSEETNKELKLVIVGDRGSGKTSLATRYSQDQFSPHYKQTMGIDFFLKRILFSGNVDVTLHVWDIDGQSIGGKMLDNYISGSNCVLFVYDVTNTSSFHGVKDWLTVIKKVFSNSEKLPHLALVGNKIDLEHIRMIRRDSHIKFADDNNMLSFMVSAKSGDSVNLCFKKIAAEILGLKLTPSEIKHQQAILKANVITYCDANPLKSIPQTKTRSTICIVS